MNRRSIVLGASVVALALTAAGPAEAGVLGELGGSLPEPGTATVKVQANVRANADLPLEPLSKGTHGSTRASTSVKAKGESQSTGTQVGAGLDGKAGTTGSVAARVGLEESARTKGIVHRDGAGPTPAAAGHRSAKLATRRIHHAAKAKRHGADRKAHQIAKPQWSAPGGGKSKDVVPLRGIGREVGNPIQLGLAGWLIALSGAAFVVASRIVRRLQHARL